MIIYIHSFSGFGGTQDYTLMLAEHASKHTPVVLIAPSIKHLSSTKNRNLTVEELPQSLCDLVNAKSPLKRILGTTILYRFLMNKVANFRDTTAIHFSTNPVVFSCFSIICSKNILLVNTFHDFGPLKTFSVSYLINSILINIARMRDIRVITPSQFIKNQFKTLVAFTPGMKINVIPTGIDPPKQKRRRVASKKLTFGMVGRCAEAKMPQLWTNAAIEYLRLFGGEKASFCWYGERDKFLPDNAFEGIAPYKNSITFFGKFDETTDVYETIDILAFSSRWEGGCPPRALLHAAFRGIPIISPKLPSILEAFGEDGCLYYEPQNAKDFVSKLIFATNEPGYMIKTASQALKIVQGHHTAQNETSQTLKIYKNMK
ncbi:glycosyltransferase family 4 protein [Alphaproteobacteria bacterium]|nr:glycosyltransferase family 4 protein [Alphaproteobacteria bacterium]